MTPDPTPRGLVLPDTEDGQLERLSNMLAAAHNRLSQSGSDEDPLVGMALASVHRHSGARYVSLQSKDTLADVELIAAATILRIALRGEANPQVAALLSKSLRCLDFALQVKTGQPSTNSRH